MRRVGRRRGVASARKRATFRASSAATARRSCSNITSRRSSVFASASCARSRSSSDARSAAFSAICASRAATSTCRVSRVRAGAQRGVRGARWTVVADPEVEDAENGSPVARCGGAKRNRRSGTHPRRAPFGVVHERQSVPGVEALRAGEAVAPDHRENHGRRPGRGASRVNDESRQFTLKLSSETGFIRLLSLIHI